MKKAILVGLGIIIVFILIAFFISLNTTCMFDGMGRGYYVEKEAFETNFSNLDLNINQDFQFNNQIDINNEKLIINYSKENALAYETHSCNGSAYFIKNNENFINTSRKEMHKLLEEKTGCDNCSVLIGYAMGNLLLKLE
jgi:hypothetical protein